MARKPKSENAGPEAKEMIAATEMPKVAQASDASEGTESLSSMLAAALLASAVGPAHGALTALEMALIELKARAIGVEGHLRDEYAQILDLIKSL